MATHDYVLANQSGSSFRSDLNNALAAIVSQNSNATEPATTYAYQYWVDTSATPALIKQRNAANDDWVTLAEVDGQTLAADGTLAKPGISFAADVNTGLRRNAADDVSIVTGGTQAITVDSSQNVGVGTNSPFTTLNVLHDGSGTSVASTGTTDATTNARIGRGAVGIDIGTLDNGTSYLQNRSISNFATNYGFIINPNGGNVGIGDIGPDATLHVRADGNEVKNLLLLQNRDSGASAASQIASVNAANDYGDNRYSYIRFITSGSGQNGNDLTFGTNANGGAPAERVRVQSNGRVLIGTTTDGGAGGLTIRPNFSNGATNVVFDRANTAVTSAVVTFENNDGTVGSITHNNSITAFNTTSDYRLKENVVDITDGITRVKQLAPKRFNFIVNPDATVDGFLAHEAQTVVPEAVFGTQDGVENIGTLTESDGAVVETDIPEPAADQLTWEETITDEDGNETVQTHTRTWTQTGSKPVYQGIDQSKLIPLLTAALQEAIAKIETLETKVAALEAAN